MNWSPRAVLAAAIDVVVVIVFVAIGRRSHDEAGTLSGIAQTAAPFLIGLGFAWMVSLGWRRPMSWVTGLIIWPLTVLVGMIVRSQVFDDGTATSFVIVATVFLGTFLVGWRLVARVIETRRRRARGARSLTA